MPKPIPSSTPFVTPYNSLIPALPFLDVVVSPYHDGIPSSKIFRKPAHRNAYVDWFSAILLPPNMEFYLDNF